MFISLSTARSFSWRIPSRMYTDMLTPSLIKTSGHIVSSGDTVQEIRESHYNTFWPSKLMPILMPLVRRPINNHLIFLLVNLPTNWSNSLDKASTIIWPNKLNQIRVEKSKAEKEWRVNHTGEKGRTQNQRRGALPSAAAEASWGGLFGLWLVLLLETYKTGLISAKISWRSAILA